MELCETFSTLGAQELENGTGNPSHPKLAVVAAGKLFYVVDNTTKIRTGILCFILEGYSKSEAEAVREAIKLKR
jgi:hypothetical protein